MASQQTFVTLNSGYQMPQLGFGTYLSTPREVEMPVLWAVDAGYRHIDCAHVYRNEVEVGRALKKRLDDGTVKREDMFITSKLWCDAHRLSDVRPACEESLHKLGLDYLDLYLIHFPVPFKLKEGQQFSATDPSVFEFEDVPLEETWKGMEQLVEAGLVRSIGVSNFNRAQLDRILAVCKIPPAVNEIEVSVSWLNEKLINYAHSKGIQTIAYAVLGSPGTRINVPSLMEEEFVKKIALAHGKTPAQVLLRHGIQRGLVVLIKSQNAERIRSNFKVFDFTLTIEEMNTLKANSPNHRLFIMPASEDHPEYPFHDEF
ncbi:hypothetical protein AAHC03_05837 [Spirometra sp. Aus1]